LPTIAASHLQRIISSAESVSSRRAAHARGLSVGLKNDLEQVKALVADFDWALNERCFRYNECTA
jgi:hypothetical protein